MESKQNETKLDRSIPFTFLIVVQKTLSLFLSIQSFSNFFPDVHRQTSRVTSFRSLSSSLVIKHGESRTRPNRFNRFPLLPLLLRQRFSQIFLYNFPPLYRIFQWANVHKHGCKPFPPNPISQQAVDHRTEPRIAN